MDTYTLAQALAHHGVKGEGDTLTDNARAQGIMSVCHGCGTVVGVTMEGTTAIEREQSRKASAIGYDRCGMLECCEDATQTLL